MFNIRVGSGFDMHALVAGRPLIIGGVTVPHSHGLLGHSDADVLLHAIADAMLGALALGDLGQFFPSNDQSIVGIDSRKILREVCEKIHTKKFTVVNVDCTVLAQAPKLEPHILLMREHIASDLVITLDRVSVKATTTDHLSSVGRKEGISAFATVLLMSHED